MKGSKDVKYNIWLLSYPLTLNECMDAAIDQSVRT